MVSSLYSERPLKPVNGREREEVRWLVWTGLWGTNRPFVWPVPVGWNDFGFTTGLANGALEAEACIFEGILFIFIFIYLCV